MSKMRDLHDQAMKLAQLALVARHQGDWQRAEELARQAFQHEAQAAELIPDDQSSEPTRSILYRSAASLAYQSREYNAAQRFIAKGLSGFPPPQIEQELKDLYQQVNFEQHLQVRGIKLENEDLQLSLEGNAVGFGEILYDEFIKRMKATRALIDRTTQRLMGRVYQGSGHLSEIYRPFQPTLVAPRGGSFTITIKFALLPNTQTSMLVSASQLIDEIVTGIELINKSDEQGLKQRIPQEGYYQNFIALTRDIAPDGDRVTSVWFTTARGAVSLQRLRTDIQIVPKLEESEGEHRPIKVDGLLDYATARKRDLIGLTTEEGHPYTIVVLEGLEDLVRSYFKQWVTITGISDGTNIYLTDLQSSSE
jgi:hypothetical protein